MLTSTSAPQPKGKDKGKSKKVPVNMWLNARELEMLGKIKDHFTDSSNAAGLRRSIILTAHVLEQVNMGRMLFTADADGKNIREIVILS